MSRVSPPQRFTDENVARPDQFFVSMLDEHQRRLYVGLESQRLGHGADRALAQITGLSVVTIASGRRELEVEHQTEQVRAPGGGCPRVEKKTRRS